MSVCLSVKNSNVGALWSLMLNTIPVSKKFFLNSGVILVMWVFVCVCQTEMWKCPKLETRPGCLRQTAGFVVMFIFHFWAVPCGIILRTSHTRVHVQQPFVTTQCCASMVCAVALSLSVPVTSGCSVERQERIQPSFDTASTFRCTSLRCRNWIWVSSEIWYFRPEYYLGLWT